MDLNLNRSEPVARELLNLFEFEFEFNRFRPVTGQTGARRLLVTGQEIKPWGALAGDGSAAAAWVRAWAVCVKGAGGIRVLVAPLAGVQFTGGCDGGGGDTCAR